MWDKITEHIKNCQEEADKRRKIVEDGWREQMKSSKKPEFVEEVEMDEETDYTDIHPSPMKSCLDGHYSSTMLRKIADAMDRWGREMEKKNAS